MSAEQTLDNAIAEAAGELIKEIEKQEPDKDKPTVINEDVGAKDDPQQDEEDQQDNKPDANELSAEALAEAKYLYKILQDPKQSPALIAALAQQVGIFKPENLPTTKKETKEASKSIAEQVIEGLGDEYKFMSPKLGAVIETILNTKIEEVRSEHSAHVNEVEQEKLVSETEFARSKLNKETNGNFDKLEGKMLKLMDEFLPSANQTVESYLRGIYAIASQGTAKANAAADLNKKIAKNANDVTSRLSSVGTGAGRGLPAGPAKPGIKNAVEFALKQLEGQNK